MQDFIYILEQLEKFNIDEKLEKLSKIFKDKKVVIFGANTSFKAISLKYDLSKYFNIIGICDEKFSPESSFEFINFKIISLQNLYFSGVEVVINLKNDFKLIERIFRKNHYIKKKVKFVSLLEKSKSQQLLEIYDKLKIAYNDYKCTNSLVNSVVSFFRFSYEDLVVKYNYDKKLAYLKKSDKPLRVLFLAHNYKDWTLSKLYKFMKHDDSYKVLPILVLPNSLSLDAVSDEDSINKFNEMGFEALEGFEYETKTCPMLEALKPDVVFYQNPELLKSNYTPAKISSYALTCFVEPELILSENEKYDTPYMKYTLFNTWKRFSSLISNFKEYSNVRFVGYSKFDAFEQSEPEKFQQLWSNSINGFDNKIVFVPSYSINPNFDVNDYLERLNYVLDFAGKNPQYSFVVIPHKSMLNQCLDNSVMTLEEYNQYFKAWQSLPNTTIADYEDLLDVFMNSDVLLTDCLNVVSDFLLSEKPIMYFENYSKPVLNEFGEKLYKTLYKVKSNEAIEIIFEDLLVNKNDYTYNERYSLLMKNNSKFLNNTAELISNELKESVLEQIGNDINETPAKVKQTSESKLN